MRLIMFGEGGTLEVLPPSKLIETPSPRDYITASTAAVQCYAGGKKLHIPFSPFDMRLVVRDDKVSFRGVEVPWDGNGFPVLRIPNQGNPAVGETCTDEIIIFKYVTYTSGKNYRAKLPGLHPEIEDIFVVDNELRVVHKNGRTATYPVKVTTEAMLYVPPAHNVAVKIIGDEEVEVIDHEQSLNLDKRFKIEPPMHLDFVVHAHSQFVDAWLATSKLYRGESDE